MTAWHPHTRPIVEEALRRGIEVQRLPGLHRGYAMLEYRGHREFIVTTVTDRIGSVVARVLRNKASSLSLLCRLGFPVAPTLFTADLDDAEAFMREHGRVAVKPADRQLGVGVSTGVADRDELDAAMELAAALSNDPRGRVIVQRHVEGQDHRVLVVDRRHVFGALRTPPFVVGDGERTVEALVGAWNATLTLAYRRIEIDEGVTDHLAEQSLEPTSIPGDGERVPLRAIANSSQGGFSHDTTDVLGEAVREMSVALAAEFDLPLVGIDVITTDIRSSPGAIIEVNPDPGILIHESPTMGQPRPIARLLVDMLFPETADEEHGPP